MSFSVAVPISFLFGLAVGAGFVGCILVLIDTVSFSSLDTRTRKQKQVTPQYQTCAHPHASDCHSKNGDMCMNSFVCPEEVSR